MAMINHWRPGWSKEQLTYCSQVANKSGVEQAGFVKQGLEGQELDLTYLTNVDET